MNRRSITTDEGNESMFESEDDNRAGLMIEKNLWVPDKSVNQCFDCYKEFSIFLRKHHCRIWGHIFCHQWSITRKLKTKSGKPQKYRFWFKCIEINMKFQEQIKSNNLFLNKIMIGSYMDKESEDLDEQDDK